ncbi:MAG: hypothetical protein GXP62_19470 [Oligoflexia bacterium]|nr:hypothetical protein [Oligoflexia bacterium]
MLALLGALAVVVAPLLLASHRALVHHARCVEHGELIELAPAAGPHVVQHAPALVSGLGHNQDGHCTLDQGLMAAVSISHGTSIELVEHPTDSPVLLTAAPRGPPLRYAPKTSPPSCA